MPRRLTWMTGSLCFIMLLSGCGPTRPNNQTAGMAARPMNAIVGQPVPTTRQQLPVQLIQFDYPGKTVRIVVTSLPVDDRTGPVGQTRAFAEYRQGPIGLTVPIGWKVRAIVPGKEPWLVSIATTAQVQHELKPRTASHAAEIAPKRAAEYSLLASSTGNRGRLLSHIHVSNTVSTPMVSTDPPVRQP